MNRSTSPLSFLVLSCLASACGGDGGSDGSGESGTLDGPLEFRGEQPFLPGFDYDSDWLPAGSPVAIRATAMAGGGITVVAQATTDGATITPVAGSGSLEVAGSLALELSAKIDTMGIAYEGVVDSFDYTIDPVAQTFEPFALDADVSATAELMPAVLGEVPIPSVPGATLMLEVTGGEIISAFAGTCAEARDGFAQYAGTLTTSGTVALAATVEIEIPIVGTQSFGPFPFDVAIPPLPSAIDLGTRSLATGEPADAMGICATDPGTESGASNAATSNADESTSNETNATSPTTDSADATSSGGADGHDESTTGAPSGDPDYPPPGACGPDDAQVMVGDQGDNGVCLPPCAADGSCPNGATGTAVGVCAFNPMSTFAPCGTDGDCSPGETCIDSTCFYQPPTHCVLTCDAGMICPDGMECLSSFCTYPV